MINRIKAILLITSLLLYFSIFAFSCISRQSLFEIANRPYIAVYNNAEEVINEENSISYGNVELYAESKEIYTIKNTGLVDLYITGISIYNPYDESASSQFILNTTTLDSVLAPGEYTDFSITFRPTSLNNTTANLYIYSNAESANPYIVTITGSGIGSTINTPDIHVFLGDYELQDSDTINIGSKQINQYGVKKFMVVNNGTASLYITDIYISDDSAMYNNDFQLITPEIPTVIKPGEQYNFYVIFHPTVNNNESVMITIESDDPDTNSFNLEVAGEGISNPIPDIMISTDKSEIISGGPYDFGIVQTGSTSQAYFTIKNIGTDTLNITGYSINPSGNFIVNNLNSVSLDPDEKLNFNVQFTPSSNGNQSADISINSNDPDENPFILKVFGTGDPNPQSDISILEASDNGLFDFGSVLLGTSKTQTFTINNNGTAPLDISDINIGGKNASNFILDISSTNFTIAPLGGTTTFNITFNPNINKPRTAIITINSNDPDTSNYKFNLNG